MKRTLVKTVAYKFVTTIELALLAWILTGSFEMAGKFGMIHLGVTSVTFAGFEAAFNAVWSMLTNRS